jgi:hypothetical protein
MKGFTNTEVFPTSLPPKRGSCGVYGIISNIDNRIYVGGSEDMGVRFSTHKYHLSKRKHCCKQLQLVHDINPSALEFFVIEEVKDQSSLRAREQFWMDFYRSYLSENGFNQSPSSDSCRDYKQTKEHIEKVASKNRGRKRPPPSDETRRRMSEAQKGKINLRDSKPVIQWSLEGQQLQTFRSVTFAASQLDLCVSGIVNCLKGRYKQAGGFRWTYASTTV